MVNNPIKTDGEGNITELTITNKMQKQLREAHKDEYKPYSVSVKACAIKSAILSILFKSKTAF
jgi:hypothetical protein